MPHTLLRSAEYIDTSPAQEIGRHREWALGQQVVSIIGAKSHDGAKRLDVAKLHTGAVNKAWSWHVTWTDMESGNTHDDHVLWSHLDAARCLRLVLVNPHQYNLWPNGGHPAHNRKLRAQRRLECTLDEQFRATEVLHHMPAAGVVERLGHIAQLSTPNET